MDVTWGVSFRNAFGRQSALWLERDHKYIFTRFELHNPMKVACFKNIFDLWKPYFHLTISHFLGGGGTLHVFNSWQMLAFIFLSRVGRSERCVLQQEILYLTLTNHCCVGINCVPSVYRLVTQGLLSTPIIANGMSCSVNGSNELNVWKKKWWGILVCSHLTFDRELWLKPPTPLCFHSWISKKDVWNM